VHHPGGYPTGGMPAAAASGGERRSAGEPPQHPVRVRGRVPWPSRAPRRIVRRGQRITDRQYPAGAVILGFDTVLYPRMPAQRLHAKPAFKANHIIPLYRSSDRHRRRRLLQLWSTPETGKRDALRQSVLQAGRPQSGDAAHSCSPRSDRDRPATASLVLALVSSLIMILAVVEVLAVRFNHVQFA
jgi:hypothetical protein